MRYGSMTVAKGGMSDRQCVGCVGKRLTHQG